MEKYCRKVRRSSSGFLNCVIILYLYTFLPQKIYCTITDNNNYRDIRCRCFQPCLQFHLPRFNFNCKQDYFVSLSPHKLNMRAYYEIYITKPIHMFSVLPSYVVQAAYDHGQISIRRVINQFCKIIFLTLKMKIYS